MWPVLFRELWHGFIDDFTEYANASEWLTTERIDHHFRELETHRTLRRYKVVTTYPRSAIPKIFNPLKLTYLLPDAARHLRRDDCAPLNGHLHQLIHLPILASQTFQARVLAIPPLARVFGAPDVNHVFSLFLGTAVENDYPELLSVVEELPVIRWKGDCATTAIHPVGFGGFTTGRNGTHLGRRLEVSTCSNGTGSVLLDQRKSVVLLNANGRGVTDGMTGKPGNRCSLSIPWQAFFSSLQLNSREFGSEISRSPGDEDWASSCSE